MLQIQFILYCNAVQNKSIQFSLVRVNYFSV